MHHDLGALGTAINKSAIERQINILKSFGTNAIRTSHNPPAPELLELADKMGILILDEVFDCWASGKTKMTTLFIIPNGIKRTLKHLFAETEIILPSLCGVWEMK